MIKCCIGSLTQSLVDEMFEKKWYDYEKKEFYAVAVDDRDHISDKCAGNNSEG